MGLINGVRHAIVLLLGVRNALEVVVLSVLTEVCLPQGLQQDMGRILSHMIMVHRVHVENGLTSAYHAMRQAALNASLAPS